LRGDVGFGGGHREGQVRDDVPEASLLAEGRAKQRAVAAGDVDQGAGGGKLEAAHNARDDGVAEVAHRLVPDVLTVQIVKGGHPAFDRGAEGAPGARRCPPPS